MDYGEGLRASLPAGGSGEVLYVHSSTDSTNTRAAELARKGAQSGTLVVADHQTSGRGRGGALWRTPPGQAIAMSLVLRPEFAGLRWSGLGAVAVVDALAGMGLPAAVKWPNDILIDGRKAGGVLAEAAWLGDRLDFLVLGIGVNVGVGAAPPDSEVDVPATSVEREAGRRIDRIELVAEIIRSIDHWRQRIRTDGFLQRWEACLAFRGDQVTVVTRHGNLVGRLEGLGPEGEAAILLADGTMAYAGADASTLRSLPAGGAELR